MRPPPIPTDAAALPDPARRALLAVAAVVIGAASLAAWPSERAGRTRWLSRIARFDAAAVMLGRLYLRANPAESPDVLERELLGSCDVDAVRDIRNRLGTLNDADYADGRLVALDGWIVTRTEARLLGLVAAYADA